MRDVQPFFRSLLRARAPVDMAVARGPCRGRSDPSFGCSLWWNFWLLRGQAPPERRARLVAYSRAALERGLVDFYLRWWNGHHCMFQGYGKALGSSAPQLEGGLSAQALAEQPSSTAVAAFRSPEWCQGLQDGCLRLALLPMDLFPPPVPGAFAAAAANSTALVGRSPRPDRGHRLRLDRYDEVDFDTQREAMVADGLWFVEDARSGGGRSGPAGTG